MSQADDYHWGPMQGNRYFALVSFDVDRAIASARLGDYEQIVFQYVREFSWGMIRLTRTKDNPYPDAPAIEVPYSALAKQVGVSRQKLHDAKVRLVRSRMLTEGPGGVTINKKAHEWVFPETGRPRLNESALAYAMKAFEDARRRRSVPPHGYNDTSETAYTCTSQEVQQSPSRTPSEVQPTPACTLPEVQPDEACTQSEVQPYPLKGTRVPAERYTPYREERARQKSSEDEEEKIAPFRASVREPADELPGPDSLWEPDPGPHRPTPDQVEAIFRLARQCYPATNIAHEIYQRQRWHKPDSWMAAIRYAATHKPGLDTCHYIEKIAATYDRDGVPVEHPTVRASPGPTVAPPPRRNWHSEMVARFRVE